MTLRLHWPAAALFAAILSVSLTPSDAALASPPPHFTSTFPPMIRHAPPPRPHYRPHHRNHRGWHSGWFWGPLAAGVTLYGVSELLDHSTQRDAYQNSLAAQQAALAAQQPTTNTVYWCEAEKGFYPQVRACPTGWTALPAGAVPP